MGTWSVIRKATKEDKIKLDARAERFAHRHGIPLLDNWTAVGSVEFHIEDEIATDDGSGNGQHLQRLWFAIVRRALGHHWAEGISHGTVGFTVK